MSDKIQIGALLLTVTGDGQLQAEQESRSAPFQLRMRPSIKAAGEKAAADQNRSLSSLMETLLIDFLKEHGYLPAPKAASKRK